MDSKERAEYISLLQREVVPALGCTEPIAVTLAVANARKALAAPVARVTAMMSANIYKNGMGVGIPGTGRTGLPLAAALGIVTGDPSRGLELLEGITPSDVDAAQKLIDGGRVEVGIAPDVEKLYVKATVTSTVGDVAHCVICHEHSHVGEIGRNGSIIYSDTAKTNERGAEQPPAHTEAIDARDITVRGIYEFATTAPLEEIDFMLETARMNSAIAREGLQKEYGLQVGRKMREQVEAGLLSDDLLTKAMTVTAAASDARMAGCTMPVMSNSGSGNQGITATLPVVVTAEVIKAPEERLARALVVAHLVAIHIKGYLGRLSALCGCVVASSGAGCGVAYLLGGGYEEICATIKNMVGNVTGMVCDGAKVGCALKVSSGVCSALQSAFLAKENICISSNDGIIDDDIEQTIRNLGRVGCDGMRQTDDLLLEIMTTKCH